jgi:S1-C subfamily serine protease
MATEHSAPPSDPVAVRADHLCEVLLARPTVEAVDEAASLLLALRDLREFDRLCALADLVCRLRWDDARARRLYAQGLIETGRLTAGVDLLEAAKDHYGEGHPEFAEFEGLLGRAYKQLFMDTVDPQGIWASTFIERAIAAYSGPYTRDRARHFWHGINLGALAHAANLRGLAPTGRSAEDYTTELLTTLEAIDPAARDQWWHATKAEAHAAQAQWEASEQALRAYIDDSRTTPFMLASTLRQLRDLWAIQRAPRGARMLQILEASLMSRPTPGAVLKMGAPHLLEMRALEPKNDVQLQRLVGPQGFESVQWYRAGLERAAAVAAVTERLGLRFGTGFAVRAEDFGIASGDEVLLLTNFHVLNSAGLGGRKDFGNVEVVFEAITDKPLKCSVHAVVAESDADDGLDFALLRLAGPIERLRPLPITRWIASADLRARVYVIGYPLGDVMQFSLQDNVLLDHECEPTGRPTNKARRRVQYSASTEKGNSGSPVFDDKWDCIALHHAGGKRNPREERYGIPRLNGLSTAWEANQGIWIGSIQDEVKARKVKLA